MIRDTSHGVILLPFLQALQGNHPASNSLPMAIGLDAKPVLGSCASDSGVEWDYRRPGGTERSG
jgi:hypothetical protein